MLCSKRSNITIFFSDVCNCLYIIIIKLPVSLYPSMINGLPYRELPGQIHVVGPILEAPRHMPTLPMAK